jgi:hypothetical protein
MPGSEKAVSHPCGLRTTRILENTDRMQASRSNRERIPALHISFGLEGITYQDNLASTGFEAVSEGRFRERRIL